MILFSCSGLGNVINTPLRLVGILGMSCHKDLSPVKLTTDAISEYTMRAIRASGRLYLSLFEVCAIRGEAVAAV